MLQLRFLSGWRKGKNDLSTSAQGHSEWNRTMKIRKYSVGQLQANCYFLIEDKKLLIIDAGGDADFLLEQIQRERLEPLGIFATHGHFDHILGVGEIQLSFDLPLYIFKQDEFLVKRAKETTRYFLRVDPQMVEPQKFKWLKTGKLTLGPFSCDVLHTPGHTPGACCFYFKKDKTIFTGDTLFKGAVGRFDHKYSDKKKLEHSLETLFKLPEETLVYPGHGEETLIQAEKEEELV